MFSPLRNWISGICRQKRILLILCTFGCSFILLNYSLLSSSSASSSSPTLSSSSSTTASHQKSRDLFSSNSNNIKAELNVINIRSSGQEKYEKEAKWKLQSSSNKWVMHVTPEKVEKEKATDEYAYTYFNEQISPSPVPAQPKHPKPNGESNNDFPSVLSQFTSNSNSNNRSKSGVTFVSATIRNRNHSTLNRINKIAQYDFGNDRGNNSNNANYGSAQGEKTDKSQSTGATIFLEESIIASNRGSSTNNNLSSSIFSIPRSPSSPPSILLHGGDGKWPFPEKVLEEPPNSSPPSSTNMASKGDRHYNNDTNSNTYRNNLISESISPSSNSNINNLNTSPSAPSPFHIPPCNTPTQLRRVQKRKKNLTVIENFIMGWKRVRCNETITYTTHGDYRYLDNLVPLVERWNGPVSLSIYAPGTDMEKTLGIISYLKMCTSSKIDEWVTFHLIYDVKFSKRPAENYNKPGDMLWLDGLYQRGKWSDCSKQPNFNKYDFTFRIENGLLYPINIARNIARAAAKTYFVLASDIELYPSINLIPNFMKMLNRLQRNEEEDRNKGANNLIKNTFTTIAESLAAKLFSSGMSTITNKITDTDSDKNETITAKDQLEASQLHVPNQGRQGQGLSNYPKGQNRHVFVLPVFEVKKDILPCQMETKEQLLTLMKRRSAVIFHHSICPQCHTFPKYEAWKGGVPSDFMKRKILLGCVANRTLNVLNSKSNSTVHPMNIFHKAKRKFPYQLWEPIFIGTKDEPIYDERLSWEGLRDKMVSGYVMCALDYDFYILDNAFLVHKPGIRKVVHVVTKTVMNQDRLINYRIRSELLKKFGRHEECAL